MEKERERLKANREKYKTLNSEDKPIQEQPEEINNIDWDNLSKGLQREPLIPLSEALAFAEYCRLKNEPTKYPSELYQEFKKFKQQNNR